MDISKQNLAVAKIDGRQFKIKEGSEIEVHRLAEKQPKDEIILDEILLAYLNGEEQDPKYIFARATVLHHHRGDKIRIIKFKRRKHHLKKMGFRADLTSLRINSIEKRT